MSWLKNIFYIVATMSGISSDIMADSPWQKSFGDVQSQEYREPDKRIPYGEADSQFIDLWLARGNEEKASPVVVLIHGGCWLEDYDIAHIRPLATALSEKDYAVWAVEYRRVGQEGGGWPGTFKDISTAVDLLLNFRHPQVDNRQAIFLGHSAGGHLALWAAGRSRLGENQELYRENPLIPVGAVGLAAITDLADYARGGNNCQQVTVRLMGGTEDEVQVRYDQASPSVLGADVPVVLIQGEADAIVPPSQADAMPDSRIVAIKQSGHFDLIHTGTPAFRELLSVLNEVLSQ